MKVPTFQRISISNCPICSAEIAESMNVQTDKAGSPSSLWWGKRGRRTLVHQEGMYCHFVVINDDETTTHKLAILAQLATRPDQKMIQPARQFPLLDVKPTGGITIQYG